jgi:hypothetical protein
MFNLKLVLPGNYTYSPYYRLIEIIAFLTFMIYLLAFIFKCTLFLSNNAFQIKHLFFSIAVVFIGFISADIVSGIVHFIGDNFGNETTPFFGSNFIRPFREHHVNPKSITEHDFFEVNGSNCFVSLFVLLPFYYQLEISSYKAFLLAVFIISLLLFIFLTNQIHKWAHQDKPPVFIKKMQQAGIILSPVHHSVHHTSPYDKYYCITCGWANPIIEYTGVFKAIVFLKNKIIGNK